MYAGASSPRADVVSFARRSDPRLRIAFRRASARADADMVVSRNWEVVVVGKEQTRFNSRPPNMDAAANRDRMAHTLLLPPFHPPEHRKKGFHVPLPFYLSYYLFPLTGWPWRG